MVFDLLNRNKTLKPLKNHGGANRNNLSNLAQSTLATLGSGSMADAVKLPKGEQLNEWLAVNTVDFFNEISMLYGTISNFCTPISCPTMSAGPTVQYLWADGVAVKKPIAVTAGEYVDLLMTWTEGQLNDETLFPVKFDSSYPKDFKKTVSVIFKRFFRVYAHIYHTHFLRIKELGAEAHLNTCFKHFVYFVKEFALVDKKEMLPLSQIVDGMLGKDSERYKELTTVGEDRENEDVNLQSEIHRQSVVQH